MFYVCKVEIFWCVYCYKVGTVVVIVVVVVEVAFLYFVVSCGIYKSVFWKVGFMESNWQSNYS